MKVLVTGGAGFIGSHIVDKLVKKKYEVVVVDNLSTGLEENVNCAAAFYKKDITDPDLEDIFIIEQPDYVIHHAAQINVQGSLKNPYLDANINILGTIRILECCRRYQIKKLIYASSAAIYGEPQYLPISEDHIIAPVSFYGISKYTPEHYIKQYAKLYGLNFTILRYANVFGIRQDPKGEGGVISIFINKILNHETPMIYGDGQQTRDFIYVSDVADANIAALSNADHEILNISCNQQTSLNQLVSYLNSLIQIQQEPIYQPERIGDIRFSVLDNSKAKRLLGWQPLFTCEEGLRETLEYYLGIYQVETSANN